MTFLAYLHPGDLDLYEWLGTLLYVVAVPVAVFGGIFLLAKLGNRPGGAKGRFESERR